MAEQILYDDLYNQLTPKEQFDYGGYKIARNLVPSESDTQDKAFPEYKEVLDAEQAAKATKPSAWNPMNWIFSPGATSEMPQNKYGLQTNTMGGVTLNPDGSLNYNNQSPNLGYTPMADAVKANANFMDQFNTESGTNLSVEDAFPGMSTGDIIDSRNNRQAIGGDVENISDLISKFNMQRMMNAPRTQMNEMNTYGNRDFTNVGGLGIANEPDVEQEEYLGNPTKFQNFKKGIMDNPLTRGAGTAFNFLRGSVPGMLMSGLGALFNRDGADYQQYTPGFDYKGLNDSMINDFYDPATGLNRFDRARKKGNTFGSARTGAEYFKLRREKKAANAAAEAKRQSDLRTVQQRAARGDSLSQIGKDMYTGSGQAFEKQKSGTFTTPSGKRGYSGGRRDGGRVGYGNGGLATLFTRRG